MVTTLVLILLLPIVGFTLQMFFGCRLPRKGDWLPTGLIGISLVLATITFVQTLGAFDPGLKQQFRWGWIDFSGFTVGMGILFDNLTAVMLMVVTIVSFLVHLFSIGYMHGDVRYSRYFGYLGLFSFSTTLCHLVRSRAPGVRPSRSRRMRSSPSAASCSGTS